jgi:two-component sensor histidine kinase
MGSFTGPGGSFLVDISNPTDPTEVHEFPTPSEGVRHADVEFDRRDGLYYRTREGGGGDGEPPNGVDVIDYGWGDGTPENPVKATRIPAGSTHNVHAHPEGDVLYTTEHHGVGVWDTSDPTDVTDAREQRARLERQNDRLDRFASIVSHDLRTPLNVVDGSVALLREATGDGDQAAVEENLDRISRACRRMNDIVENVLTLARQPDRIDDTDDVPLAETVTSVWHDLDAEGAVLVVDVDVDGRATTTLRADEHALRRLLENLFVNAVTHGSADGDTVTVRVEWAAGDEGDAGEPGFAVSDDGPGLSDEAREHAFDWGYTTDGSGVGFGLGIVQRIAEAHGWTVSVTESAAGGARFEVRGVDCAARSSDAVTEPEQCE